MKITSLIAIVASACVLAACSDSPEAPADNGGVPGQGNQVPPSATTSSAAYVGYVGSLQASESDQPLGVNNVTPPTSETAQPQTL